MKKIFYFTLLGIIFLGLVGCGNNDKNLENINTNITELEEVNNKITEYFESVKENTFNLSAHYVDTENDVVIVELLTNSTEEQELFKNLVVDSEYIKFIQGGPYTTSNYELNEKTISELAYLYLPLETQKTITNRDNPNIEILESNDYEKFICSDNEEISNIKIYSVEFITDSLSKPNNVFVILNYNTLELLGFPLVD